MDVFKEIIWKRLNENGWPRSPGWFMKKVLIEDVVWQSAEDAVRIAITIGSELPELAESIAISYVFSPTKQSVNDWIDRASNDGQFKLDANIEPPIPVPYPEGSWLRFCQGWFAKASYSGYSSQAPKQLIPVFGSVTAYNKSMLDPREKNLKGERTWDDPQFEEMVTMGRNNALSAMAWALRNPDKCVDLFDQSKFGTPYPKDAGIQPLLPDPQQIYDEWFLLARQYISNLPVFSGLSKLDDLPPV